MDWKRVTDGDIHIDGRRVNDLPAAQRGLAMVFQSYALYPHMTVRQNMAFGLENIGTPRKEIEARIAEAARMLRLDQLLQRDRRSCRAVSGSASRSAAPSCGSPRSFCSMSLCRISMRNSASVCGQNWRSCIAALKRR